MEARAHRKHDINAALMFFLKEYGNMKEFEVTFAVMVTPFTSKRNWI